MDTALTVVFQYFIGVLATDVFTRAESVNVSCNFEKDNCNWVSLNGIFQWNLVSATKLMPFINDHTTNSEIGRYMRIQANSQGDTGYLVSPKLTPNEATCLSFWYYIHGERIKLFEVYQNFNLISAIDIQQQNHWNQHLVSLNDSALYQITLKATFEQCYNYNGSSCLSFIIVDDVITTDTVCTDVPDKTAQSPYTSTIIVSGSPFDSTTIGNTAVSGSPFDSTTIGTTAVSGSPFDSTLIGTTAELSISPTKVGTATDVPDETAQSPNTSTIIGITVGIICGLVFVIGLTALLLFVVRRFKAFKRNSGCDNDMVPPYRHSNNDGYTDVLPGNNDISNYSTLIGHASNNNGYTDLLPRNDTDASTYSSIGTGHSLNYASNNDGYIDVLP